MKYNDLYSPEIVWLTGQGRKLRRARNVIKRVERQGLTGQGIVIMERYRKAKALLLAQKLSED